MGGELAAARLTRGRVRATNTRSSPSVFIRVHLWFLFFMLADGVVEAFRLQGEFCDQFGSPLYAGLLARAAEDMERGGGPLVALLDGSTGNPIPDGLVLRLMGAVHRLVLDGAAPELARYYPSAGGVPESAAAW